MIRVVTEKTNHWVHLEMEGHSFLAEAGNDIVCAAASVLVENLALSLTQLTPAQPKIQKSSGYFRLDIPEPTLESDLLMASAILGLRQIAIQYPDRVSISQK